MTPAELSDAVVAAVRAAVDAGALAVPLPETVTVERPKVKEHGDYATNIAMQLAKPAGRPPREVAELLAAELRKSPGVASVEVAGPGFLNIRLDESALGEIARTVVVAGDTYGTSDTLAKLRINLEFVSANPTGPVHLGHTRWAAVGDSLRRLLEAAGADVTAEHYVNDAGVQMQRFGESVYAAAHGRPAPEDGYGGAYVADVARQVVAQEPGILEAQEQEATERFREAGYRVMLEEMRQSLERFGVEFDVWFSERTLHETGAVEHALDELRRQGHVYDQDGAIWLRTTEFGDDKDRVLVKSDGEKTYFAADAAYYINKRERGFERCVYMLGADHHGYVGRMMAMCAAFGDEPGKNLEILIGQMVNLLRDGQPLRMSKRAGTVVTIDDLVEAIGVDFDVYFHENSLHESKAVERAIERLQSLGKMYEAEGALWLRTTDFGDDRDRVV
ncbi:MAG TPA: arginine--tRNA ligase, partial [Mycobacteriales bacterium]|nr:arginine--tRNA ligase [Mycobacteriales bacterium]